MIFWWFVQYNINKSVRNASNERFTSSNSDFFDILRSVHWKTMKKPRLIVFAAFLLLRMLIPMLLLFLFVVHVQNNELILFHSYILFIVNDFYIPLGCAVTFFCSSKICLSKSSVIYFFSSFMALSLPNLFNAFHLYHTVSVPEQKPLKFIISSHDQLDFLVSFLSFFFSSFDENLFLRLKKKNIYI